MLTVKRDRGSIWEGLWCLFAEAWDHSKFHRDSVKYVEDKIQDKSIKQCYAQARKWKTYKNKKHTLQRWHVTVPIRQQRHPTIEDDIGDSRRDEIRQSAADRSQLTSSGNTCRHMRQPYRRDATAGTWLSAADGKARMANQTIRISNKRMSCRLIKN